VARHDGLGDAAEGRGDVPERAAAAGLAVLADVACETPGEERHMGVVDRFFAEKGFGFVQYEKGQSIFFHVTQCEGGADGISPGVRVTFRVGHNPKKGKTQAEALRRADD
jgi:cold shock CspA family protein